MRLHHRLQAIVISACLSLAACGDGGGQYANDGGVGGTGIAARGLAQKGPFLIGSVVDVTALDPSGNALDTSLTTQTTDSLGNFSFRLTEPGPALITVTGYHYNEIDGNLSDDTLTLRGIFEFDDEDEQQVNVNVLTHLIHLRVQNLMQLGFRAEYSIARAEQEWQLAFASVANDVGASQFGQLSIYSEEGYVGDDYLLFVSALFYQYAANLADVTGVAVDAKLAEVLNNVADDFRDDGEIDDQALLQALPIVANTLDPDQIEENLEEQSLDVTGEILAVADIRAFLDNIVIAFPAAESVLSEITEVRVLGLEDIPGILLFAARGWTACQPAHNCRERRVESLLLVK